MGLGKSEKGGKLCWGLVDSSPVCGVGGKGNSTFLKQNTGHYAVCSCSTSPMTAEHLL